MSEKLGVGNMGSGASGGGMGESRKVVSGGGVGGSESKTLALNPGDKGGLSGVTRVPEGNSKVVYEETSDGGWNVIESGSIQRNDKQDAGKSGVAGGLMSHGRGDDDGWDTGVVMNLVGRVLNKDRCMDSGVGNVNNSRRGPELNRRSGADAWQPGIGKPTPSNRMDIKGTAAYKDSGGKLETEEVSDSEADVWTSQEFEEYITEKEGEYYVAQLVWGKVRSHPWWPGQIFSPSDASDEAERYFKSNSYLIAYFGDQTFAWNEESKVKPFLMHFSEMAKQTNGNRLSHAVDCALDEVARRVELGLSCGCLPQEVQDKIKYQVVVNAGIREESSRRAGGDPLFGAFSFLPEEFLEFIESVAITPHCKTDRLQHAITKAQLLAFKRWKGQYQLSAFEEYSDLWEEFTVTGESKEPMLVIEGLSLCPGSEGAKKFPSRKRKSTAWDASQKGKHMSVDGMGPKMKEKYLSALMSSSSSGSQGDGKKPAHRTGKEAAGESRRLEMIPDEIPTPDEILSKLALAAKDPMLGHVAADSIIGLLHEFRIMICQEKSGSGNTDQVAEQPANLVTADILGFEGTEDSYWPGRIVQSYPQDQVLFGPEKPGERVVGAEANVGAVLNLGTRRERDAVIADLEAENPSDVKSEVLEEEHSPAKLLLSFKNLVSIPPVAKLNEIFSRYGPLRESETEILGKSMRAMVIFKRRADAVAAVRRIRKPDIFGPSLLGCDLKCAPPLCSLKPEERDTSLKGNAV